MSLRTLTATACRCTNTRPLFRVVTSHSGGSVSTNTRALSSSTNLPLPQRTTLTRVSTSTITTSTSPNTLHLSTWSNSRRTQSLSSWQTRRRFVSSSPSTSAAAAAVTSTNSSTDDPELSTLAKLLSTPEPAALKEIIDEADILSEERAQIGITGRAAEHLRSISTQENNPNVALRIAVESGGCHGYQYKMELTSEKAEDDYLFGHPSTSPSNVIIDAVSLNLLKGSTLDFATELIGSSFRILDNPQAKGSGCGCGVSWEANI